MDQDETIEIIALSKALAFGGCAATVTCLVSPENPETVIFQVRLEGSGEREGDLIWELLGSKGTSAREGGIYTSIVAQQIDSTTILQLFSLLTYFHPASGSSALSVHAIRMVGFK